MLDDDCDGPICDECGKPCPDDAVVVIDGEVFCEECGLPIQQARDDDEEIEAAVKEADAEWLPQVQMLEIKIPRLPPRDVLLHEARATAPHDVDGPDPDEVERRLIHNYIRHNLTPYDDWLDVIPRNALGARECLRKRIAAAIDEALRAIAEPA
jgi:hypothetical protein